MARTESPITILAGEDLPAYRRVRQVGSSWMLADAGETHEAVTATYILSGARGAAWSANDSGLMPIECSAAITAGQTCFAGDDGKVLDVGPGLEQGLCVNGTSASGDVAQVVPGCSPFPNGLVYVNTAASAAVTNTTTATDFDKTHSIPANSLKAGDIVRVKFQGIATATNSTDTLAIDLKVGSVTLLSLAAVDVANSDVFQGEMDMVVRTVGDSGTVVGHGQAAVIGAAATATDRPRILASTTLDTTAANTVKVTATWSVANAGNSCRLDVLSVEILRRQAA